MDSLDLFRRCVWNIDRDEADARLEAILAWVGQSALPERVFTHDQLAAWAHKNGYARADEPKQIAALLREAQRYIHPHDTLASKVAAAVAEFG